MSDLSDPSEPTGHAGHNGHDGHEQGDPTEIEIDMDDFDADALNAMVGGGLFEGPVQAQEAGPDEHAGHEHSHEGGEHDHKHADPFDEDQHRELAVGLFNQVWELLRTPNRSPFQDDQMVHAAHASRWHWGQVRQGSGPQQLAVGEWQCSRVYAVLGRGEPAMHHARSSLAICQESGLGDWVLAAAYEALARAAWVTGDRQGFGIWLERAQAATAAIANPQDRTVIEQDLAGLGR
ncbi:MAG: hypothetical protein E6J47_02715 [Chloroflexi bacterium]|nr:MAG: hypothetical protein E6J47_02715 [Chloroflexota bacterium]